MEKKYINKLFPWLGETDAKYDIKKHLENCGSFCIKPDTKDSLDDVTSFLFAPDPLTGLPSSDIGLLVKGKMSGDIAKVIDELGIQRVHEDTQRLSDDTSSDFVKSRRLQYGTERLNYINALKKVAKDGYDSFKASIENSNNE